MQMLKINRKIQNKIGHAHIEVAHLNFLLVFLQSNHIIISSSALFD
jgi:hypothetical protein